MNLSPPLLFLAGSPGPLELLLIFAVALMLFGPKKLPGIARSLGRMLGELRKASDEFRRQFMSMEDGVGGHDGTRKDAGVPPVSRGGEAEGEAAADAAQGQDDPLADTLPAGDYDTDTTHEETQQHDDRH